MKNTLVYAGFWIRLVAFVLDGFVVLFLTLALSLMLMVLGLAFLFALSAMSTFWLPEAHGSVSMLLYAMFLYMVSFSPFLLYIVSAIYYTLMESGKRGAGYGKRWMGLRVLNTHGKRLSVKQAFLRWLCHLISYFTMYVGFLIQPFTSRRQALHDLIAETIVVVEPPQEHR